MSQSGPRVFRFRDIVDIINEIICMYHDPYFTSEFINIIAPYNIINKVIKGAIKITSRRSKITFGKLGVIINPKPYNNDDWRGGNKDNHMGYYVLPYIIFTMSASLINYVGYHKVIENNTFIYNKDPGKLRYIDNKPVWNHKALYITIVGEGINSGAHYNFVCVTKGVKHQESNGTSCFLCGERMAEDSYVSWLLNRKVKPRGLKDDLYYCYGCADEKDTTLVNFVSSTVGKKYITFARQVSREGLTRIGNYDDECANIWKSGPYEIIDSIYEGDYVTDGGKLVVIDMRHIRDLSNGFTFVPAFSS